jgi:hypothetical protein
VNSSPPTHAKATSTAVQRTPAPTGPAWPCIAHTKYMHTGAHTRPTAPTTHTSCYTKWTHSSWGGVWQNLATQPWYSTGKVTTLHNSTNVQQTTLLQLHASSNNAEQRFALPPLLTLHSSHAPPSSVPCSHCRWFAHQHNVLLAALQRSVEPRTCGRTHRYTHMVPSC